AHLVRREPCHRAQQRTVEQLPVQPPHLARLLLPLLRDGGDRVGPVAQLSTEPPQVVVVRRHQVSTSQAVQLHPVLEGAQQPVRRVEPRAVLTAHVPTGRQRGDGGQRARGT